MCIVCLVRIGYDGPERNSGGLGLEIKEWNVAHKKFEKQYRIFETFLAIVPVKLNFWELSYFAGLKDNIKQTTQLNHSKNNSKRP